MKNILQDIQKNIDSSSKLAILGDFLIENKQRNEFGMNITMVQGFLYAIASAPCPISPGEWTVFIFGGIPEFQSMEQQKDIYEAALALYAYIESKLALVDRKSDLFLWIKDGLAINLRLANNRHLIDFCSGYVKGYLLDPILKKTFADIPDLSLAYFMSIIKLAADNDKKLSDIDEVMRKTLQHLMVENYLNWIELRRANLGKK